MENQTADRNIEGLFRENDNNPNKFKAIAEIYRDKISIEAKGYSPGDSMPAQREMAATHGTTRTTIARAMEILVGEGLIIPNGNHRAIIAEQVNRVPSMGDRMAQLRETGEIMGKGEECEVLSASTVPCPARIASYLRVNPGDDVLLRTRVTRRNGKPMAISESYYPEFAVEAAPELAERENIKGGARELPVYRLDRVQEDAEETFTARPATDREKKLLELSSKYATVLQNLRVVAMDDGRIVEVAIKVSEGSIPVVTRRSLRPNH